jgi:uncharacterized membrane protein
MPDVIAQAPAIDLTQDEKAFAGLAHALMTCTWWIGPLVIYLTKKESRFVSFHALQALFWQIIFTVLYFGGIAVWMVFVFSTIALHPLNRPANQPFPVGVFILLPFFWLFIMGAFAVTLTLAIMYCLKAMRGEWAGYPIIGRWARRIVGF